jgi:hypothetical protein
MACLGVCGGGLGVLRVSGRLWCQLGWVLLVSETVLSGGFREVVVGLVGSQSERWWLDWLKARLSTARAKQHRTPRMVCPAMLNIGGGAVRQEYCCVPRRKVPSCFTAAQDTVGRTKDNVHDLQGSGGCRPRCEPWRAEIGQLSSCLQGWLLEATHALDRSTALVYCMCGCSCATGRVKLHSVGCWPSLWVVGLPAAVKGKP